MSIAHPLRLSGWGLAALILLAPLIAMRFTDQVAWGIEDFAAAALLLGGTGLALELTVRRSASRWTLAAVAVALLTALALVWATLAVGIAGPEGHPANGVVFVILGIAILGTLHAKARPRGMVLAMLATAAAQLACGVVAGIAGPGIPAFATLGFAAAWLASALTFARAAQRSRIP